MLLESLANQRLALLGFGREGRAFAELMAVRHPAARLTVLAETEPDSRPRSWPLEVGPFELKTDRFDVSVRSPGVQPHHPALAAFRRDGGTVINPASIWFAERPEEFVIAVTGSKGKSTTAALIAHLARECGKETVLAGNIGIPLLEHLETLADLFVVELSSFQLTDLVGRPSVGVMTRLFPEHLDWHGGAQAYYQAKLRLLDLLSDAPLVVNGADPELVEMTDACENRILANHAPGIHARKQGLYRGQECLLPAAEFALPGRHNVDNLAVAVHTGLVLGLKLERMLAAAPGFRPLAHRLEPVLNENRRQWINDSIATSPHATRAALESLDGLPVTLIAGGMERGSDWRPVIEWCRNTPLDALITLPDNGKHVAALLSAAAAVRPDRIFHAESMEQAVDLAMNCTPAGGAVVLSPGAPSFPRFRDFEDRGDCFRKLVLGARG